MNRQDPVYGKIPIPHDVQLIIKTDVFQRLKRIKQLGLLPLILPFADHTRYDHCIGTYHLCRKFLNVLEKNTDWVASDPIGIPLAYRTAVELAGLLHDVGHGPFSHVWESVNENFHHEQNAVPCIDAIFENIDKEAFPELRAENNYGIALIKALILGDQNLLPTPLPVRYNFIFEIVNNTQCKLDVDKWDYLKRDHFYLSELCDPEMDFDDVFLNARVSNDGEHIEYRYKDYDKIYKLFEARWCLHVNCYRVPQILACDAILKDMLQRIQPVVNRKSVLDIDANNISEFIALTDDQIFSFVRMDEKFKYLADVNKIKQFNGNCLSEEDILEVEDIIPGPGEVMPPDDKFHFYGDASSKESIYRNKMPIKSSIRLLLT